MIKINKIKTIEFLINNHSFIIAFSALLLSLLMIFQIIFLTRNVDVSVAFQTAEIFEESAEGLQESVEKLEDGAVKNSYENISSIFMENAEERRKAALKGLISIGLYSVSAVSLVGVAGNYLFDFIKKKFD